MVASQTQEAECERAIEQAQGVARERRARARGRGGGAVRRRGAHLLRRALSPQLRAVHQALRRDRHVLGGVLPLPVRGGPLGLLGAPRLGEPPRAAGAAAVPRDTAALKNKDLFVVTTNVDGQFEKAGLAPERLFAVQGDYGLNQCARGCHDGLYPNRDLAESILAAAREDGDPTRAPNGLVPRCPVCGGPKTVHVRVDGSFVEDAAWREAQKRYLHFVERMHGKPAVLLELGVGWNNPGVIRLPFEWLSALAGVPLVRMNRDDARVPAGGAGLQGDIAELWPLVAPCGA